MGRRVSPFCSRWACGHCVHVPPWSWWGGGLGLDVDADAGLMRSPTTMKWAGCWLPASESAGRSESQGRTTLALYVRAMRMCQFWAVSRRSIESDQAFLLDGSNHPQHTTMARWNDACRASGRLQPLLFLAQGALRVLIQTASDPDYRCKGGIRIKWAALPHSHTSHPSTGRRPPCNPFRGRRRHLGSAAADSFFVYPPPTRRRQGLATTQRSRARGGALEPD